LAKTERIVVRVEPDVKANAEAVFRSMGINTSDAINMFLHQVIQQNQLPFTVGAGAVSLRSADRR